MKAIIRTKLAKANKGKWVALKQDRKALVASGRTASSVYKAAKKNGCKRPVITHIPLRIQYLLVALINSVEFPYVKIGSSLSLF